MSNGFICASVQQGNQISKKSLAMIVTQLMVDLKPELQKKTEVHLCDNGDVTL